MDQVGSVVGGIVRVDVLTDAVGAEDFEEVFGGVGGALAECGKQRSFRDAASTMT